MRKTKIVCTLGPSTDDPQVMRELMLAGMNVARFNFSHGTHEDHLDRLKLVKRMRAELGLPIATMLDTKGPEVRIGLFENGSITLKEGDKFTLTTDEIMAIKKNVQLSMQISRKMLRSAQEFCSLTALLK